MLPDSFICHRDSISFVKMNEGYYVGAKSFYLFDEEFVIEIGLTGELELLRYREQFTDFYAFCIFTNKHFDNRFVHGGI